MSFYPLPFPHPVVRRPVIRRPVVGYPVYSGSIGGAGNDIISINNGGVGPPGPPGPPGPAGNVTVSSSGTANINTRGTAVSSNVTATDDYVGATASGITLTLPLGVTGTQYILKNEVGSGLVTVAATGPNTIDDSATKNMTANASITVVFRAGDWRII